MTIHLSNSLFRRLLSSAVLVAALLPGMGALAADLHLRVEAVNHTAAVRRIALSPDETLLATAGDDKTARIWQVADRRLLATLRVPIGEGDVGRLYGAAFSPDGKAVAVAGTQGDSRSPHRIDVFDAGNGAHLRTLALDAGNVVRLLWTRNGRDLAACLAGGNGIRIQPASGGPAFSDSFAQPCFGLAELPDGSLLASGFDGKIRHYRPDGASWTRVRQIDTEIADPQSLAVSPDGRHFAVGYRSRLPSREVAIDVFDTVKGTLARRFAFSDLRGGSLGSVAWSRDGRTLAASGRASDSDGYRLRMILKRITWPQGSVSTDFVATDTIQDMVPLAQDRFVVASSNGSWAVVPASGAVAPLGASVIDLRGPDNLKVGDDPGVVSFGSAAWSGATQFSVRARELQSGEASGLAAPKRFSFGLSIERWENEYQPSIAGRPVPMAPLELSRAVALLPDDGGLVLGTSRTLRRLDRQGQQRWSVRTGSEVSSVNVSRDGRVVIGAQMDGTIGWWRADDGKPLLTLFVTIDGKWVLWTPDGYYDAAAGAESLIGWHVNRADGKGVDFFSIGKFRDKYHRPDVIDRVLELRDPQLALVQADQQRRAQPDAGPPPDDSPPVVAAPVADPQVQMLPPVVSVITQRMLRSSERTMRIEFSLRAGQQPVDTMVVRVDGRPVELASIAMPAQQDGEAIGRLQVTMPERSAEVTVMGQAGSVYSEPVYLSWNWRPPAPPAPAPAAPSAAPRVTTPAAPVAAAPVAAAPAVAATAVPAPGVAAPVAAAPVAAAAPPAGPVAVAPPVAATVPPAISAPVASAPPAAAPATPSSPGQSPPASSPGRAIASASPLGSSGVSIQALQDSLMPQSSLPLGISLPAPLPTPPAGPPAAAAAAGPPTPPVFLKSRLFIVAVGVSTYARREYSLELAAKDATDFSNLMDAQVGRMYSSVEKRLLTNEAATRASVLAALEWLRQSTGPDDTGMLFIAGHGLNDSSGKYFFLPHDVDLKRLARSAIGEAELRKALAGLRGKAMMFVDTCHSGNVLGSGISVNNEVGRLANTLAAAENGVIVFSASTGKQESIESKSWGNGAFTKALIAGLTGGADFRKDGVVTHQGLSYFLGQEVKTLTKGRQTPVTAVPMGMVDFPLVAFAAR